MAATELEISSTLKWLKTAKHVVVNDEWLEACISWLKSHNAAREDFSILRNDVYEQWLMSDLNESGSSCLPDEISTHPMTNIPGIIALQMNSIVDISASAYSQLKKLKNEVTSNEDDNETAPWRSTEPKPCRMLKLELTDGERTVEGMEYKPMKKISTDLIPGTKILIKAVLCRCGMLFLTDEKIEILGGQVKHLIEENSQYNILNKLVLNAKGRNGRFQDNTDTRQSQGSLNNSSFPRQPLKWTKPPNNEDFQALLNEDEDFLAELDEPIVNSEECHGHEEELHGHEEELNDYQHMLDSDELNGQEELSDYQHMLDSEELGNHEELNDYQPMLDSEERNGHEELNDYQDELDDDLNYLLNSEEDISEDVLNDLENSSFIADIEC